MQPLMQTWSAKSKVKLRKYSIILLADGTRKWKKFIYDQGHWGIQMVTTLSARQLHSLGLGRCLPGGLGQWGQRFGREIRLADEIIITLKVCL